MRSPDFPITGSKRKLLDAAEQLFADKGFDAVSVRDITSLAKQNVAAVNYHFGSRDALLNLVMMRFMEPVTEERIVRLEVLEKLPVGELRLEAILEAMVLPLIGEVTKSDLSERLFHRLMGRIFSQQGNGAPLVIEAQIERVNDRFNGLFAHVLPHLTAEELAWRTHFVVGGMLYLLTHQDIITRLSKGASGSPSMAVTMQRFVEFAAAGMRTGEIGQMGKPEKRQPAALELVEAAPKVVESPQVMFDF